MAKATNRPEEMDDESMEVDDEQPLVRLTSSDGKRFVLSRAQAACSNALRTMIESSQNTSNAPTEYINLQSVNSQMLSKVVEWMDWHSCPMQTTMASDSGPPRKASFVGASNDRDAAANNSDATYPKESNDYVITEKDKAFLDSMSEMELFKLTHVANYLDVPTLFSACCQTIARRWEGKKVAEIRKMYNIVGDFSCEEEREMMQENKRFGMTD